MNKILVASLFAGLLALSNSTMAQNAQSTAPSKTSPAPKSANATPVDAVSEQASPNASKSKATPSAVITSININTASAEQLSLLNGIGAAKAAAIINYREQHGPFASIDDLSKVSGIGPATVEKNRHLLTK